jgi:hypothetical protein
MNNCPCNGCVPPKRTPTCHSTCEAYKDWKIAHELERAKIMEIQKEYDDLFPIRFKRRRRM